MVVFGKVSSSVAAASRVISCAMIGLVSVIPAKQLAADERHSVRPQHAGRGGDRRDRLEPQVRSGQAGMLLGQVVRDRPRDP